MFHVRRYRGHGPPPTWKDLLLALVVALGIAAIASIVFWEIP